MVHFVNLTCPTYVQSFNSLCTGSLTCQDRISHKTVSPSVPFLSVMNIKPNVDGPSFDVVAVLDPLSQGTPIIHLFVLFWFLSTNTACECTVTHCCCVKQHLAQADKTQRNKSTIVRHKTVNPVHCYSNALVMLIGSL